MQKLLCSGAIASWLLVGVACGGTPVQPSPQPAQPSAPASPPPFVPEPGANGSVTWVSINSPRELCIELTRQVGQTWSIWLEMEVAGDDVMLTMSEIPLPVGPLDEGPARFTGSRRGDRVVAARLPPFGGMACPGDGRVTRQTAGTLTATITGDEIAGELTEIFGSGSDQITFGSRFRATLPE